jgi:5'-deoxynucleotidase YfbR-like HD superfamily hydrolase
MSEFGPTTPKQFELERINRLLAAPVELIDGSQASADELWCRAFTSPYGSYMDSQPLRFSHDFSYEPTKMITDLGMDVLPLEHQIGTGKFAAYIIDREATGQQPFGDEEAGVIMFASLIHDMGESMHPDIQKQLGRVVGDIPYGRKSDDDRQAEAAVRHFIYRELYSDVPEATLATIESIIMHEPSRLHDVFEAAHCLQALETGICARQRFFERWEAYLVNPRVDEAEEGRYRALAALADAVLKNMIPHAEHWANTFAFAAEFLLENRYAIQAHKLSAIGLREVLVEQVSGGA